jgi:hypothetical protein
MKGNVHIDIAELGGPKKSKAPKERAASARPGGQASKRAAAARSRSASSWPNKKAMAGESSGGSGRSKEGQQSSGGKGTSTLKFLLLAVWGHTGMH